MAKAKQEKGKIAQKMSHKIRSFKFLQRARLLSYIFSGLVKSKQYNKTSSPRASEALFETFSHDENGG